MVLGSEHYCDGWRPWVCYGAPICDPDSGLAMGAVDITGPAAAADLQTLALTISIAQSVEQQLELALLRNRDLLRSRFREIEKRWPSEGLILLSDAGRVVELNRVAQRGLRLDDSVVVDRLLGDVLPDLWMLGRDLVQTGKYGERSGDVQLSLGEERTVSCLSEPIHSENRKIGAILVIKGLHRPQPTQVVSRRASSAPELDARRATWFAAR